MNVIISGLTAAGKTTHTKLLAERFNLQYVSATEALARLSGIGPGTEPSSSDFWISDAAAKLNEVRKKSHSIDLAVDDELKGLSHTLNSAVFDAWGLPWISDAPAIRIWLESTFESRLMKAIVSHRFHKHLTHAAIAGIVKKKDEQTRELFLNLYSFDIFRDRDVFDLVIDISSFIRKPHVLSSRRSIRLADRIITSFVGARVSRVQEYRCCFS